MNHLQEAWARRIEASKTAASNVLYHLADKVDFKLDPNFHPENNTTWGGDWPEAGIFLGKSVEAWVNGYGYWRPWVVEFEVSGVDLNWGGYSGEVFVPATDFDKIRISRVIPLDAHCREEYGDWGWVEDNDGITFDTEEPFERKGYHDWSGYRYPGDARQSDPAWRARYEKRVRAFARSKGH